jgi:hypothetical protein
VARTGTDNAAAPYLNRRRGRKDVTDYPWPMCVVCVDLDEQSEYANHSNARRANELLSRPRTWFVGHAAPSGA